MHSRLQQIYLQLESDRKKLLTEVSILSDDEFIRVPPSGKWSVSQIVAHLMTSERLSLVYMRKKILGADQLKNSGMLESAKLALLKISQRLPIRYKAPPVVLQHTPDALTLLPLLEKWDNVRGDLKTFLASVEEKNIHKKIYKHPVAGMLDIPQALLFFNEHVHHHWPQIKHLLKK